MGAPMRRLSVMPVVVVMLGAALAVATMAAVAFAGSPSGSGGASPGTGSGSTGSGGTPGSKPPATAPGKVKAVTIAVAPNPMTAKTPIVISGRVLPGKRSGVAVTLWRMLPRERRFHVAARVRTDSTGRYVATLTGVNTNTRWYAAAGGTNSRTLSERVHALIILFPSNSL